MPDSILLTSDTLIPAGWLQTTFLADFRAYNLAIVRFRKRLLMAYRVDSGHRATVQRRISNT